ncbi:CIC11C00000006069 [Sungouiella intermedia]|uniref:CIC11C00000006069 n=1 Tax=Sungouiella intermedia TaxID=45354 RepID=A0A1L0E1R2_9ASCO|nr:CIC11C00000006069 [[Candida] intermedia]
MSSFRRQFIDSSSVSLSNSPFQNSPLKNSTHNAMSIHLGHSASNLANIMVPLSYGSLHGSIHNNNNSTRSNSVSYDEHVANIGTSNPASIDYKTVTKHLGSPDETLKMQGGDVARYLYHQIENANKNANGGGKGRARSSSFSNLIDARRESTASDINVPGGFRREFLINRSLQQNKPPPNFLTRNFVEFLSIYGHFAGEDFDDDDDDESSEESYEDVFDEESLLLQERRPVGSVPKKRKKTAHKGTASQVKTFFLLFKALVGSGVLFLPGAFHHGGLLFSTIVMMIFGFLTYICYIVLIFSKKILGKSSFGELAFLTYGNPLKYSIMVSIILAQIGFVATYILFTAENMALFMEGFFHITVSKANIVILQCLILIPFVLIRDLTKLSFTSLLSSVFILVGLMIIFYFSGLQLIEHGIGPNIVQFNSKTWSMLIGVAVTAFEGIGLILPIEASMAHPEKFPFVLSMSMLIITALFVAIGAIGYSSFGENVKSIIILNLPLTNIAVQLIMVLYSIAVFLTAPLQLFPAIRIGELVLFNSRLFLTKEQQSHTEEGKLYHNSGKYNPHIKWIKNILRAASVVFISCVAYLNANNIDKFVSFNGCFACIPLVYIYPPMIHLKTYKTQPNQLMFFKYFDWAIIVVGVLAVFYTSYQILFAIE